MTGPTSQESRSGGPDLQLAHRRLQHFERAVGDVVLQAEHAQRRAALAGRIEGGGEHVGHDLFGERGTVDDQRVLAAGLGDQRNRRAVGRRAAGRAQPAMSRATSVEPVNMTPATCGMGGERRADRAVADAASRSASAGTPASCSRRTAASAISGVSSAGLAMTALPAASAAAT